MAYQNLQWKAAFPFRQKHTNVTGFVSEDIALKCPENIFKGRGVIASTFKAVPHMVVHLGMDIATEED